MNLCSKMYRSACACAGQFNLTTSSWDPVLIITLFQKNVFRLEILLLETETEKNIHTVYSRLIIYSSKYIFLSLSIPHSFSLSLCLFHFHFLLFSVTVSFLYYSLSLDHSYSISKRGHLLK